MEERIIQSKITNKDIVIRIPKQWIINDFNEMMEWCRVKGNKKTEFIKEFTNQLVDNIIDNEVFVDIYNELSDTELVVEDDEW